MFWIGAKKENGAFEWLNGTELVKDDWKKQTGKACCCSDITSFLVIACSASIHLAFDKWLTICVCK